jgi:hypothetical protein
MENFSHHVPFLVVTGGVKQSGHSSELTAGQVGLFDRANFSVATSVGQGKELFIAQGAIGGKDWFGSPVTESHKSPFFLAKDVEDMYLSKPQTIQNEEWVIGYNGSASSKSLVFEEGKALRVKFHFHGQPIYRFFGGPKEYVVSYTPLKGCLAPCAEGDCPDPITDCLEHTKAVINEINEHTELKKFGVRATLVNHPFTAATPNMTKYQLKVCDNGDSVSLQAVQAQYPGIKVTRVKREGSTSTYELCIPTVDGAPSNFAQSGSVLLSVCSTCPAGSTLTSGKDIYYVSRVVTPSTDLSTTNAQQTFATAVATSYFPAKTFNAATNVDANSITVTAHGWVTGTQVTYANGGGTSVVGLTSGSNYFVIRVNANTVKLATTYANAVAGTAITITDGIGTSHTLTPVIDAKFISLTGSNANVKLTVPTSSTVTAINSDVVDFAFTEGETCVFTAPAAISWVSSGTAVRAKRTMKIKALQRTDCTSGNRLADLTAILTGVPGVNIATLTKIAGDACADDYTVEQWSNDCISEEACLTNGVSHTYDFLPAFENKSWELVPETISTNDERKCGIRVSAGYIDPKFGNCTFMPTDYYENEPLKMEVSLLVEDGSACDYANAPSVQQTKIGRLARQSGEYVVREVIMKTDGYLKHLDQFSADARMREAFDQNLLSMVDRNAFYDLYYVRFRASYGQYSFRKNEQERFTAVFAFKVGDPTEATFKSAILDTLTAKSGVTLHINE